jgi:Protein of unknown function (DUF2769)
MEHAIIYLLIRNRGITGVREIMTEDQKKSMEENRKKCICEPCPTYNECMRAENELLFCVNGKALKCTFDRKGCVCPTCPVHAVLSLKKAYYCVKGTELEQPRTW